MGKLSRHINGPRVLVGGCSRALGTRDTIYTVGRESGFAEPVKWFTEQKFLLSRLDLTPELNLWNIEDKKNRLLKIVL